jgi:hypothetical protein
MSRDERALQLRVLIGIGLDKKSYQLSALIQCRPPGNVSPLHLPWSGCLSKACHNDRQVAWPENADNSVEPILLGCLARTGEDWRGLAKPSHQVTIAWRPFSTIRLADNL